MADQSVNKELVAEVPPFFYYYKDGSIVRSSPLPLVPPSSESTAPLQEGDGDGGVASKDIILNPELGLWARIFVPLQQHGHNQDRCGRLPVVLYFHGGGFLFGSPDWDNFHVFCSNMALRSRSIWISASYRLAPEHRLPAAIDDGYSALLWVQSQAALAAEPTTSDVEGGMADPWLCDRADFSKCFISGESAGATLAHHVVIRGMGQSSSLHPLCIRGLILIHPGFMRPDRTQEEMDAPQDVYANWDAAESCLLLTLPPGSISESFPYWNPLPELCSRKDMNLFPKTLVALADKDMLYIMGLEYVAALKAASCRVDLEISHGVGHVFFIAQPESEQAESLKQRITGFILEE